MNIKRIWCSDCEEMSLPKLGGIHIRPCEKSNQYLIWY